MAKRVCRGSTERRWSSLDEVLEQGQAQRGDRAVGEAAEPAPGAAAMPARMASAGSGNDDTMLAPVSAAMPARMASRLGR